MACWDLYWSIGSKQGRSANLGGSRGQGDQIARPRPLWHGCWCTANICFISCFHFLLQQALADGLPRREAGAGSGVVLKCGLCAASHVALCALCGSLTWQASCSAKEPIGQANGNRPQHRDTDPRWVSQAQAAQANERRTKTPLLPQPPPRMACGSLYSIPFPLIWESPYLLPSHPKLPWPFDAFGGTWNSDHYIQDSQWCWNDETVLVSALPMQPSEYWDLWID